MSEWQPIETAPKDGTPFMALNHDREVFVSMYEREAPFRLCFRKNALYEPKAYLVHEIDGKRLLEEYDDGQRAEWVNSWCLWTRGYEFKPTHWMPLPAPPENAPTK